MSLMRIFTCIWYHWSLIYVLHRIKQHVDLIFAVHLGRPLRRTKWQCTMQFNSMCVLISPDIIILVITHNHSHRSHCTRWSIITMLDCTVDSWDKTCVMQTFTEQNQDQSLIMSNNFWRSGLRWVQATCPGRQLLQTKTIIIDYHTKFLFCNI